MSNRREFESYGTVPSGTTFIREYRQTRTPHARHFVWNPAFWAGFLTFLAIMGGIALVVLVWAVWSKHPVGQLGIDFWSIFAASGVAVGGGAAVGLVVYFEQLEHYRELLNPAEREFEIEAKPKSPTFTVEPKPGQAGRNVIGGYRGRPGWLSDLAKRLIDDNALEEGARIKRKSLRGIVTSLNNNYSTIIDDLIGWGWANEVSNGFYVWTEAGVNRMIEISDKAPYPPPKTSVR
jgi:hypothetical protein